jgi:uncharacterized protein (DUF885 family)
VAATAEPNGALLAAFEAAFEAELDRSPQFATSLGDKRNQHLWGDVTPAAQALALRQRRQALDKINRDIPVAALTPANQLSLRLFQRQVERAEAGAPFELHAYPFNQMFGVQSEAPTFLMNQHRITSPTDAEAYLGRLVRLPELFRQHLANVQAARARGITMPAFVFDYVLNDCRNLLAGVPFGPGPGETPLWSDLQRKVNGLDLDPAEKQRLIARGRDILVGSVAPAYAEVVTRLTAEQARARHTDGVWALPEGEAYYAERLATQTNTRLTAAEIHDIGVSEVARLHGEMQAIMTRVGFSGDLRAFFRFMETDPRFFLPATPEGRAKYIADATAAIEAMRTRLPGFFNLQPRAPMEVRAVEAFREQSAGLAFYQRPAPDGSRPGIYYINTFNMAAIPTYQLEALAFHEGIPGHHMQVAIAQELPGLPRFRRFGRGGLTAYSEGWALYTELLAKEMGFYQDPYSDFGRLTMELRRAIRLVVDTGLHAKRWPRQQAIAYILQNQPGDEPSARRDIDRYIVMPGQACAYLIGQREILRLRAEAQARLGPRFDIRTFHDIVLGEGAVPLDILAERVGAWT